MIKVAHILQKEIVEKEVFSIPSFLLTDKKGGWFSQSTGTNLSRFQGNVFLDDEMKPWKVIESIGLVGLEPTHLVNSFYQVERLSGKAKEHFFLDEKTLVYDVAHFDGEVQLTLDSRPYYDTDDKDRYYRIYHEDEALIVEYEKENQHKLYLVIRTHCDYKRLQDWKKTVYEYDNRRNSPPGELYVFDALKFRIRYNGRIVFAWGHDLKEAKQRADHMAVNADKIRQLSKTYWTHAAAPDDRIPHQIIRMAYSCAKYSLDSLIHKVGKHEGIFAGLPWFHQFWARDEAICLKGTMLMGRYNLTKDILMRQLSQLTDEGLMKTRYPVQKGDLSSSDATGWTFARLDELISMLIRKNKLKEYFSEEDLHMIVTKLEEAIVSLIKYHTQKGLAVNRGLETWMDTTAGTDTRVGACIEMQALRARIYRFMEKLLKQAENKEDLEMYYHLEHEFQKRVKNIFWNGEYLADNINKQIDITIRPNALLAGYLDKDILTKNEWVGAVRTMMPKLWCSWGGVTTIDKEHELFKSQYTGEDNKSYHRGDSWFWVNNLSAVFLHRIDKDLFKEFVENILNSSAEEILFSGFIGHAAELSSASALESHGCWAQAWSVATFIELVNEVYGLG